MKAIPTLILVFLSLWVSTAFCQKTHRAHYLDTLKVRWEVIPMEDGRMDTVAQLNAKKIKHGILEVYRDEDFSNLLYTATIKKKEPLRDEAYFYPNGRIKMTSQARLVWVTKDTLKREIIASSNDTSYVTSDHQMARPCGLYEAWHPNGLIRTKGQYHYVEGNGCVPYGSWSHHTDEGLLTKEESYNAIGQLSGPFRKYYSNGEVATSGQYLNGKRTGLWEIFDYEGQLIRSSQY